MMMAPVDGWFSRGGGGGGGRSGPPSPPPPLLDCAWSWCSLEEQIKKGIHCLSPTFDSLVAVLRTEVEKRRIHVQK